MSSEAERNGSIHFMTLFNRQGKTRLAKWCAQPARGSWQGGGSETVFPGLSAIVALR
eukprot:SAG31_NODE_45883_length_257_cov_0.537975_1_plen_56_part_10